MTHISNTRIMNANQEEEEKEEGQTEETSHFNMTMISVVKSF